MIDGLILASGLFFLVHGLCWRETGGWCGFLGGSDRVGEVI